MCTGNPFITIFLLSSATLLSFSSLSFHLAVCGCVMCSSLYPIWADVSLVLRLPTHNGDCSCAHARLVSAGMLVWLCSHFPLFALTLCSCTGLLNTCHFCTVPPFPPPPPTHRFPELPLLNESISHQRILQAWFLFTLFGC